MGIYAVAMCSLLLTGCDERIGPPLDSDGDGVFDEFDLCPTLPEVRNGVFDSDGCPDQVEDLYAAVRADVEPFAAAVYFQLSRGFQYTPVQRFVLFRGSSASACGVGQVAFYCGADLGVYLDEFFMLDQLHRIGDFAPAVIIAHEIGHHIQRQTGILGQVPTIVTELAADCFAGAWASTAGARGLLDVGDLAEGSRAFFEVGDPPGTPWFQPGAHGSPSQRQEAFMRGLQFGALAC